MNKREKRERTNGSQSVSPSDKQIIIISNKKIAVLWFTLSALITREEAAGTTSILACRFWTINFTVTRRPFQSAVLLAMSSPIFLGDYFERPKRKWKSYRFNELKVSSDFQKNPKEIPPSSQPLQSGVRRNLLPKKNNEVSYQTKRTDFRSQRWTTRGFTTCCSQDDYK